MKYLYLVFNIFLVATTSVFGTLYNKLNEKAPCTVWLHNAIVCAGALLAWGVNCIISFHFTPVELVYSTIFAVCYCVFFMCMIRALEHGSTSLTSLIAQLSLIGVTVWGFVFWNEDVTWTVIVGLIVTVIALALCLYEKNSEKKNINLKWIIFAAVMFLTNAAAAIADKTFILTYGQEYNASMMFFAMAFAFVICTVIFAFSDKTNVKTALKRSWYVPLASGVCNGIHNMLVGILAVMLPTVVVYPVIAVGGLAVSIIAALFIFKERLEKIQWLGIAIGAVAILLLNL